MNDKELLLELLAAEHENDGIWALQKRGLFADAKRWVALGGMANNQSVVHAQQSSAAAALVEKFTNGLDAILLRRCKAAGLDPRGTPADVEKAGHEWGFTVFCFFPSKQSPSWKYLVGPDGKILTAGTAPLGLVPKLGAKSGEVCAPRERTVPHGTLIKMYDYKAPRSNICGELFRKLEEYLLRPMMPLRLVECRPEYKANVMANTVWDRFAAWEARGKFEEGFEEGASIQVKLSTGEVIPAEVRVFKTDKDKSEDAERPQTGLRALINGQSHAKRDTQFFKGKAVDKEYIGGSMLVTLDGSDLGQTSRNALFMSNRETFREDPLLNELFKKLQNELKNHIYQ